MSNLPLYDLLAWIDAGRPPHELPGHRPSQIAHGLEVLLAAPSAGQGSEGPLVVWNRDTWAYSLTSAGRTALDQRTAKHAACLAPGAVPAEAQHAARRTLLLARWHRLQRTRQHITDGVRDGLGELAAILLVAGMVSLVLYVGAVLVMAVARAAGR